VTSFVRTSIDGVYVQATAVNNLVRGEGLAELAMWAGGLIAVLFASISALAALALGPVALVVSYLGLAFAWTAGATAAFRHALALPLVEPLFAGAIAIALAGSFRQVVSERDKRLLRKSFALYLAPAVIEKMVASKKPPALGGETRVITVFFSDLAGFSTLAETMMPGELVTLMNAYLSAMTEIIEQHGGFVDKYIGDAIVAVFGAPLDDADHAGNAVRAALRCRARLVELNAGAAELKGHALRHRIGLNTGEALVGNIGSGRRFNYTVVGDAVNIAARLEGANAFFGTTMLAAQATVALAGARFDWREIDAVRVKGRAQPVAIFEPLAEAGHASAEQSASAASYAQGLACWRRRDFAGAAAHFGESAATDPPSARFLSRAKTMTQSPPGHDWEPVNTLEGK
jgi:class 3 adenylate cyclase